MLGPRAQRHLGAGAQRGGIGRHLHQAAKSAGVVYTGAAGDEPADQPGVAGLAATYLRNDWYQDWGDLQRLDPLDDGAVPATVNTGTESTWGWSRPGAIRVVADDE